MHGLPRSLKMICISVSENTVTKMNQPFVNACAIGWNNIVFEKPHSTTFFERTAIENMGRNGQGEKEGMIVRRAKMNNLLAYHLGLFQGGVCMAQKPPSFTFIYSWGIHFLSNVNHQPTRAARWLDGVVRVIFVIPM
jgi:hypothetical protein